MRTVPLPLLHITQVAYKSIQSNQLKSATRPSFHPSPPSWRQENTQARFLNRPSQCQIRARSTLPGIPSTHSIAQVLNPQSSTHNTAIESKNLNQQNLNRQNLNRQNLNRQSHLYNNQIRYATKNPFRIHSE